jgi:hypothetical protein
VEEQEGRKRACHAGRAYDHELHGLAVTADDPFRDVCLWKLDLDARLSPDQRRACFCWGHLFHRLAASSREGLQKDLDVPLDSGTSGWTIRHATAPSNW